MASIAASIARIKQDALGALGQVERGSDPAGAKQDAKGAPTVEALAKLYLSGMPRPTAGPGKRTSVELIRTLFPRSGIIKPISSLQPI